MPDLIRHPVYSWIPAFACLQQAGGNDNFQVFNCRSRKSAICCAATVFRKLTMQYGLLFSDTGGMARFVEMLPL